MDITFSNIPGHVRILKRVLSCCRKRDNRSCPFAVTVKKEMILWDTSQGIYLLLAFFLAMWWLVGAKGKHW